MIFDFTLSLPVLFLIGTTLLGVVTWLYQNKSKTDSVAERINELEKDVENLEMTLSDFKFEIITNYTSIAVLKETETRLTQSFDNLAFEIRELRKIFMENLNKK